MPAYGVLALGGFLLVVALLIVVARRKSDGPDDDLKGARGFIGTQIDEHIEALAQTYLAARPDLGVRQPGTDRFVQQIELFIGDVLLRRAERSEPWLKEALREVLVLERDYVYGEVVERVQAHLRRPSSAR